MKPLAMVLLAVASGSMLFASRRLARYLTGVLSLGPFSPGALTGGLFLGLFLPSVAIGGRLSSAMDPGLVVAALVGSIAAFGARRLALPELPRASRRQEIEFGLALIALLALYTHVALLYQMHDEHALFGHKSMVEQLRRGVYPPYYPPMPGIGARYHYGFDVLAGALARAFGVSSDAAIDAVCLAMVLFLTWAAAALSAALGAKRGVGLAALAIHLGGGLAFVLLAGTPGRHPRCLAQYHHPSCEVELFPTQFLNVFQHPVSVGVPMFLVLVLLLSRLPKAQPSGRRMAVGATVLVLGATAVGQFVYFALSWLAALAALGFWAFSLPAEERKAAVGRVLLTLGLGLVLAFVVGGMLSPHPHIDKSLVAFRMRPGFPKEEGVGGILWHHAVNLGLGFLVLPYVIRKALQTREPGLLMLLAFALGGATVPHLFVYRRSWDIVKFPSAASFALSMLYVVVVDQALRARELSMQGALRAGMLWLRRAGAVLLMGSGAVSAAYVAKPLPQPNRLYPLGNHRCDPLVRQAIDWLKAQDYQSRDLIYAQGNIANLLSIFGGLSVVGTDGDLYTQGIYAKEMNRQRRLVNRARISLDRKTLEALGIRWIVFSDEEIKHLGSAAKRALNDDKGALELMHTIKADGPGRRRRIWRLRSGAGQI